MARNFYIAWTQERCVAVHHGPVELQVLGHKAPLLIIVCLAPILLLSNNEMGRWGPVGKCAWRSLELQHMVKSAVNARLFSWAHEVGKLLAIASNPVPQLTQHCDRKVRLWPFTRGCDDGMPCEWL